MVNIWQGHHNHQPQETIEESTLHKLFSTLSTFCAFDIMDLLTGPKITYQDGSIDATNTRTVVHLNSSGTQILINAFEIVILDLKPTETGNQ